MLMPHPLHKTRKSEELNLEKLYPDLNHISTISIWNRALRMFDEAEKFDRDGLSVSAERSLAIASLLEDEYNRRKAEQGDQ